MIGRAVALCTRPRVDERDLPEAIQRFRDSPAYSECHCGPPSVVPVDSSNGLIPATIDYDGGDDFDYLVLGGAAVDSASYTMGADVSSGTNIMSLGAATQIVNYSNIEPVYDNITATNLVVNGTTGGNLINYTAGPGGGPA